MTWGDPRGLARFHPAKLAYGGAHGYEEENRAVEASLEAGINLFDTAAFYSGGHRNYASASWHGAKTSSSPANSRPGSGFRPTTFRASWMRA
jgi:aryl-alcohol dehydrogenase-like predicted oxidoreductase